MTLFVFLFEKILVQSLLQMYRCSMAAVNPTINTNTCVKGGAKEVDFEILLC